MIRCLPILILLIACAAYPLQAENATNSASSQPLTNWEAALMAVHTNDAPATGHVLVPGDVVEVKVYQEEELNTRARIETDGTVAMPLLGLVKLSGKTVGQAQKHVHDLLQADYLQHPQVALAVVESAKKRFCVLGEVRQPGFYSIPENETITLLQAISLAGGYTPFSQPSRITIKRVQDGVETVLSVDAKAMARKVDVAVMEIKANDTILINPKLF